MKPPMAPTRISGMIAGIDSGPVYRLQVYIAVTSTRISRNAVLLTVPLMVMTLSPAPTTRPLLASRKVLALSAGLPLRMKVTSVLEFVRLSYR